MPNAVAQSGAEVGVPVGGIECSIQLGKGIYEIGEEIIATVVVSNTTATSISTPDLKIPYYNYRFAVVQHPYRLVARTAKALGYEANLGDTSVTTTVLPAGGRFVDRINLAELFEIHEPGTYYVNATRLRMRTAEGKLAEVLSGNAVMVIRNSGGASPSPALPATPPLGHVPNGSKVPIRDAENGIAPKSPKSPGATQSQQGGLPAIGAPASSSGYTPAHQHSQDRTNGLTSLPPLAAATGRSSTGSSWILIVLMVGSLSVLAFVLLRASGRPKP